jgi:hypothetical protein
LRSAAGRYLAQANGEKYLNSLKSIKSLKVSSMGRALDAAGAVSVGEMGVGGAEVCVARPLPNGAGKIIQERATEVQHYLASVYNK